MDDKELRRQLEQLHAELRQIETPDEREKELLRGLVRDIGEVLGREEDHPQRYGGLVERLRETVARLEASHTRAALLTSQVIDALSYLGV